MLSLLLNFVYFIIILLDTCSLPRYRWDQLLVLAWRAFLPLVLVGVFFVTVVFVSNLAFFPFSHSSFLMFSTILKMKSKMPCGLRMYAVHRAHTPLVTKSSQDSLNNNPIFCLHRKQNNKIGQHTEWTVECCKKNDCNTNLCTDVCDTSVGVYAISHFTHSNKNSSLLSTTDLDGNKHTQYFKNLYDEPHEVTSQSLDLEKDKQKTSKLNEILKEISDDK